MTEVGQEHDAPGPGPGWYPDPWAAGYHRYWDGGGWTSDSFPNGPAIPSPAREQPIEAAPPETASKSRPIAAGLGFVAFVVALMLVVGSLAIVGGYYAFGRRKSSPPAAAPLPTTPRTTPAFPRIPGSTVPTVPPDPSASVLSGLVVTQADLGATGFVLPLRGGQQLSVATLDLCAGTYPSEALRTARLQVTVLAVTATEPLSTEAVLYASPGATAQAFAELKTVTGTCPASTHFNPAPDGGWPQVPTVERVAYDFVTTDQSGGTSHSVAVYLRRGRVLEGVYFYLPAAEQLSIAGQTTMAGITNVFATRIAQLPASVVGG